MITDRASVWKDTPRKATCRHGLVPDGEKSYGIGRMGQAEKTEPASHKALTEVSAGLASAKNTPDSALVKSNMAEIR